MPRPESEEDDAALLDSAFSTSKKADRNDGAGHAESDAARMETESEADGERNNSTSRRARSASTRMVLSTNTVKSDGGPPDKIPNWSRNKSTVKISCS